MFFFNTKKKQAFKKKHDLFSKMLYFSNTIFSGPDQTSTAQGMRGYVMYSHPHLGFDLFPYFPMGAPLYIN